MNNDLNPKICEDRCIITTKNFLYISIVLMLMDNVQEICFCNSLRVLTLDIWQRNASSFVQKNRVF